MGRSVLQVSNPKLLPVDVEPVSFSLNPPRDLFLEWLWLSHPVTVGASPWEHWREANQWSLCPNFSWLPWNGVCLLSAGNHRHLDWGSSPAVPAHSIWQCVPLLCFSLKASGVLCLHCMFFLVIQASLLLSHTPGSGDKADYFIPFPHCVLCLQLLAGLKFSCKLLPGSQGSTPSFLSQAVIFQSLDFGKEALESLIYCCSLPCYVF